MDEKKRRGRKPLEKPVVTEPVVEKKRGRKPKAVYNAFDANASAVQINSLSDDENIIVRLNVGVGRSSGGEVGAASTGGTFGDGCAHGFADLEFATAAGIEQETDGEHDTEHPYAYNRDEYKNVFIQPSDIQTLREVEAPPDLKVVSLLKDFEEKNKNKEWPSNTSISCYWCCHKFDNAPIGITVILQKNVFHVFGCFCSLNCAAAYNFSSTNNIDEMWERYNLINLLSRRLNGETQVRPAPDRLALKMFGGYMDIDQFRKYTEGRKVINVNFPPMSSITQQIEEINEYELNNDYRYIPLDHDRINKIKEQMVVKRIKPIIHKNSLETSMNLKMVRG